jgi:serine protease Do
MRKHPPRRTEFIPFPCRTELIPRNGINSVLLSRFKAVFQRFLLFGVLSLSLGLAVAAEAQQTPSLPASLERPNANWSKQRERLQQELQRHTPAVEALSSTVKIVAKLIVPSVVHIEADVPVDAESNHREHEETGSGVVIQWKNRFYVLTNWHVVQNAATDAIRIGLSDGYNIHPEKIWTDPKSDVAVLAVSATDLVPAMLGDSDRLDFGDFALAVGSPFGLRHSVTFGVISAKGRHNLRLGEHHTQVTIDFQDFLQSDVAINPGNSGGPLVNLRGEVIGINDSIASISGGNEGVGFAIPINMFMSVARQLIETGRVTRAYLGVSLNAKFGPAMAAELGLPRQIGAHVTAITAQSPAEAANLRAGDVILEFNHVPVEDDSHLINLVGLAQVGKKASLLIFRDRMPVTIMVELSDRSRFEP